MIDETAWAGEPDFKPKPAKPKDNDIHGTYAALDPWPADGFAKLTDDELRDGVFGASLPDFKPDEPEDD